MNRELIRKTGSSLDDVKVSAVSADLLVLRGDSFASVRLCRAEQDARSCQFSE
jgi:hypothetical protein